MTDAWTQMMTAMMAQGQEMAKAFAPALEGIDVKGFEKLFPTMPRDMLEAWFGKAFNPEMGFLVRKNYRRTEGRVSVTYDPKRWDWIRRISPHSNFNMFWNREDGRLETGDGKPCRRVDIAAGRWQFRRRWVGADWRGATGRRAGKARQPDRPSRSLAVRSDIWKGDRAAAEDRESAKDSAGFLNCRDHREESGDHRCCNRAEQGGARQRSGQHAAQRTADTRARQESRASTHGSFAAREHMR